MRICSIINSQKNHFNKYSEQKEIKHNDSIGTLTIPDILLDNAPIKESVELSTLSEAIGHFTSTSLYSGNVGLASHNGGGKGDYFKNLNKGGALPDPLAVTARVTAEVPGPESDPDLGTGETAGG